MISDHLNDVKQSFVRAVPITVAGQAEEIRRIIIDRTKSGRSVTGSPFAPYSVKYARKRKGGRITPVTLTNKNVMLESLRVQKHGTKATVSLPRNQAIKGSTLHYGRKSGTPMPARPWFDLSQGESREMERRFKNSMTVNHGRLRKDGGRDQRTTLKINIGG